MDYITLTTDPLNILDLYNRVVSPSCGAVSTFIGTTRNHFDGKKVVQLEYDAYIPMAEKEIGNICKRIRNDWPGIGNIAVVHRLGIVPVSEASVVIAIASEHRDASLRATRFAIDELKATVPIWKKEIYESECNGKWKENEECAWK